MCRLRCLSIIEAERANVAMCVCEMICALQKTISRIRCRALKLSLMLALGIMISQSAHAMRTVLQEPRQVEIVNLVVNSEHKAAIPEGLFIVRLNDSNEYRITYEVSEPIPDEEQADIRKVMGDKLTPQVRYVDKGNRFFGTMPADVRQAFRGMILSSLSNGVYYYPISEDSCINISAEYMRGIEFVVTNTPPPLEVSERMHPVFKKIYSAGHANHL